MVTANDDPKAPAADVGPRLLKRKELAKALNCSLRSIDAMQADGVPCFFIGKARRFVFDEVVAWLRRKGGAR